MRRLQEDAEGLNGLGLFWRYLALVLLSQGLTLATLVAFLAFLSLLCLRVGSPGAGGVVDVGLVGLAFALAVALQAVDATMDALFLEQKP